MAPQDLIDDLRSRINPAYEMQRGTESYERRMCVEVLEGQAHEIKRLTAALKKANETSERFEREWYLRGDAIEALLACPSGEYCDAYPEAERKARALLTPNG